MEPRDFDYRRDTQRTGADPDKHSDKLHRAHIALWSKPLPTGGSWRLEDGRPSNYLVHSTKPDPLFLSSDAVIPTFGRKASALIGSLDSSEYEDFVAATYTLGGYMLWPSHRVEGRQTINQARGLHPRISDRFDLTLECIRRHYEESESSPLTEVLERYRPFFDLFGSFEGFVDFFLLQDAAPRGEVLFALPFSDFSSSPIPQTRDHYRQYRDNCVEVLTRRGERMERALSSPDAP